MIKVYGCSDDLVEIEGSTYEEDEIGCYDRDVLIYFTDGTVIRVHYGKPGLGVWKITVEERGSAPQILTECDDEDVDIYSDIFEISAEIRKYEMRGAGMKEYIDRAMAFATLVDFPGELSPENIGLAVARKAIDALPAADVVEVRHGRWLEYDGADKGFHYCSECKRQAFNYEDGEVVAEVLSDWCPHCGTRMDKETDHEAGA